MASSCAALRFPETRLDAVRIGSAFTGRLPRVSPHSGLKPAATAICAVCDIRDLPKGATIGYNSVCKTKRPTRIGILPVGGADGYCLAKVRDTYRYRDAIGYMASEAKRGLTRHRLTVTVNGKRCVVLGHVGLSHTVIDLTGTDVQIGDTAELNLSPLYARLPRSYIE